VVEGGVGGGGERWVDMCGAGGGEGEGRGGEGGGWGEACEGGERGYGGGEVCGGVAPGQLASMKKDKWRERRETQRGHKSRNVDTSRIHALTSDTGERYPGRRKGDLRLKLSC